MSEQRITNRGWLGILVKHHSEKMMEILFSLPQALFRWDINIPRARYTTDGQTFVLYTSILNVIYCNRPFKHKHAHFRKYEVISPAHI